MMNNFKTLQSMMKYTFIFLTFSLHAQSLSFNPMATLFELEQDHWALGQPMIPYARPESGIVDFYGLTGSRYKKHTYTSGHYPETEFFLAGDFSYILDVHDFDEDGVPDLLTDADVWKGLGPTNFSPRLGIFNFDGSLDYDGDGLKDVIDTRTTATSNLSSIYVWRNQGNMQFNRLWIEENKRRIWSVFTADINADGRDDIVTVNSSSAVPFAVFISHEDGSITTREISSNNISFLDYSIALVDMDQDGDIDLIAMDNADGMWYIENIDDFATTEWKRLPAFDGIENKLFVHTDDLNGDGWPELILATFTDTELTLYISEGTGPMEFAAPEVLGTVMGGSTSGFAPEGKAVMRLLHTIDINGDGKKDIVMTSTFDKKQVAWYNTSDISRTEDIHWSPSFYPNPVADAITIEADVAYHYQITDITGRPMLSGSASDIQTIDVSRLSMGIYILTLRHPNGATHSASFIKK
jgi:hypothetical protein